MRTFWSRIPPDNARQNDRPRALELLRRFGGDPIVWQTLESPFRYWFAESGSVGYVDTGTAWVAAGDPVGPEPLLPQLAQAFCSAARAAHRRPIFFGAAPALIATLHGRCLRIGQRPYWNPALWSLEGRRRAALRYQLKRAAKQGVRIRRVDARELEDASQPPRREIDRLATAWLERRAMAPMGFVVSLELYVYPELHLYFVAERADRVVGFLSAVPVFGRRGWFAEDLLRSHDAPNGTGELLIHAFLEQAREEGAEYATLGLAPLAGPLATPLRLTRWLARPLFDFEGLARFKDKLRPDGYEPRFIGAPQSTSRIRALYEVLSAFSRIGLLPFGLKTLARGSLAVVAALTALLVAWIPLLALAPTGKWFPSPLWQRGWLVFDLFLAYGLFRLCRNYRHGLAIGLACAVSGDALLTFAQAIVFNRNQVQVPWEAATLAFACAGPIAGAAALWTVVRRQSRYYRAKIK